MTFFRKIFGNCKDRWFHEWEKKEDERTCKHCNRKEVLKITYVSYCTENVVYGWVVKE
jgi:hypothetical protein